MSEPTMTPEQQAQMEELAKRAQRQSEIAATLPDSLPTITKIIMSGDLESAERVDRAFRSGEFDEPRWEGDDRTPFQRAVTMLGSYARLDYALRWVEDALAERDELLDILVDEWPSCDPDDTDERFVALWREAFERNGRKVLRDGKHLPKGSVLRVYRGQPAGAPVGCAWSLDEKIAEKFAKGAWARTPVEGGEVLVLDVPRSHILAYLTRRNESEVILDPQWISRVTK